MTTSHLAKMEARMKLTLRNTVLSLTKAALLASGSSAPPAAVHETVGPSLSASTTAEAGHLVVYSATAWTSLYDDGPSQLNHTDYEIDAADGTLIDRVNNGDEKPAQVTLSKGNYTVVAQSDTSGTVSVPVRIETGKTTLLHLDREKDWKVPAEVRGADLVRLANGQPIGYRASPIRSIDGTVVTAAQSKHHPALLQD